MCGILAILYSKYPNKEQLKKYLNSSNYLSKRGPDSTVTMLENNGLFLFHRLAINDTSSGGNQPMFDNNIIMMCNGEIYNHLELQKQYDIKCESKSDCEIILKLYKKLGFEETVNKLYGVYAIVLVDGNKIYCARDRIGVRPLFYGFNSENDICISSIPNTLTFYCDKIFELPPFSILEYDRKIKNIGVYTNNLVSNEILFDEEVIISKIHETLFESVRKRLMTDRPMCTLLSGGLDSSIITAILVKLVGAENVRTFSIGMEGSTDLFYAQKVADFLGTKHTEVLFTPEEGFAVIPEVIESLASYDITTIRASVGMHLISKYISKNTTNKVIFSGEGSDELLQGYLYFHNAPSYEEGNLESLRLIKELHLYDVLRCDRCISNNGLEPRVPFLDKDFVDLVLSIDSKLKWPKYKNIEKYLLRVAFQNYLPNDIVWRKKEGFSDGVSSMKKPWYSYIQEMVENKISDEIFNHTCFPSKEAMYYKLIFDKLFPNYKLNLNYWMPKWSNQKDPSGRLITTN